MGNADHVVVKQLRAGETEVDTFEADTTIPGGGNIGFGVGEKANFRFDDVGYTTSDVLTASETLRYHYDANSRVVGRTLNPGPSEESQFFIYDGDRIIQELDETGALVAAWDYGVYIDEILVMYRDMDSDTILEPYYYLQDDHYNVIGLTDAAGNIVERYAYNDYGAPTFYDGAGNPIAGTQYYNYFLFQGRRWDAFLDLYDYRTRYYDPYMGRFLRIDTIGPWGDANNMGNPYAFVGNNPWTHLDPYGEAWISSQEGGAIHTEPTVEGEIILGTFEGAGRTLVGVGVGIYHIGVGGIGAYTGSETYSTSDEEYNQIGEAIYGFFTNPKQTTVDAYENAVQSATNALIEGDGRALGEQIGSTTTQLLILGETVANPLA